SPGGRGAAQLDRGHRQHPHEVGERIGSLEEDMALHRLTTVTIGVPDVAAAATYYEEFGLTPRGNGRFATADGGQQLQLVAAPLRRPIELGIGADDADDVGRVTAALRRLGVECTQTGDAVGAIDAGTRVRVSVSVAPRITAAACSAQATNG